MDRGLAFLSQTARRQDDVWDRGLQRPGLGTGYSQGSDLQGQAVSGLRAGEDRLPGAHRSWPSTALHPSRKFNSSHMCVTICVPSMWKNAAYGWDHVHPTLRLCARSKNSSKQNPDRVRQLQVSQQPVGAKSTTVKRYVTRVSPTNHRAGNEAPTREEHCEEMQKRAYRVLK